MEIPCPNTIISHGKGFVFIRTEIAVTCLAPIPCNVRPGAAQRHEPEEITGRLPERWAYGGWLFPFEPAREQRRSAGIFRSRRKTLKQIYSIPLLGQLR